MSLALQGRRTRYRWTSRRRADQAATRVSYSGVGRARGPGSRRPGARERLTDVAVVGLLGVGGLHLAVAFFLPIGVGIAESPYDRQFFVIELVVVTAGLSLLALGAHAARERRAWPGVALVLPAVAFLVEPDIVVLAAMELAAIGLLPIALIRRRARRRRRTPSPPTA